MSYDGLNLVAHGQLIQTRFIGKHGWFEVSELWIGNEIDEK